MVTSRFWPALAPSSPLMAFSTAAAVLAVTCLAGCRAGSVAAPDGGGTGAVQEPRPGDVVKPEADPVYPDLVAAEVLDDSGAPPANDGSPLGWTNVPALRDVRVAAGRDSAIITMPVVAGVGEYRAFALVDGMTVRSDAGGETVTGVHMFCAGLRQRNAPEQEVAELLRQIEIAGLKGPTRVVVEAIDTLCPFTGIRGVESAIIDADPSDVEEEDWVKFKISTRAELEQDYHGSLIENGHRSESLALAAPYIEPRVLARTTILVTPSSAPPPVTTFFDGFVDSSDQPVFVDDLPDEDRRSQRAKLFQNSKWNFHSYGATRRQFFVAEGRLHTILADWAQNIFSSNVMYPRQAAQLSATNYLHVTFEVASNATQRRYWWFSLCGAETAGQTIDASTGRLKGEMVQTPFFYQDDGKNPSVEGWNCLQIFPRDGWPRDLEPSDERPQSDLRVMVNMAGSPGRDNVVNVSPPQFKNAGKPGWYRQQDASGALVKPMLDDRLLIAPRTRFDLYVRRDRVVVYVNGEQRLCNDFPETPLTMAEAALGFGQVLYHSSAERIEFSRGYWDRTGQLYYLNNTPYADVRTWDNLGYQENSGAPASFDAKPCYVSDRTL